MINDLVRPGQFVRITSAGMVAVGPVHSCFYEDVYEDEKLESRVGEEVAGIEMYDITRSNLDIRHSPIDDRIKYRYWKVLDHGPHKVEVWIHDSPGKWLQVYPRSFGGITYEERRQASK